MGENMSANLSVHQERVLRFVMEQSTRENATYLAHIGDPTGDQWAALMVTCAHAEKKLS
jgi:hypothetical protein